jgi:CheY-like chemotaxis protein
LTIASGLVKLLGGELMVDSELTKGSSFHFRLPDNIVTSTEVNKKSAKPVSVPGGPSPLVLVAEDDEYSYLYVELILKEAGFRVIHARDGQEAVDHCHSRNDIALILMDMKMPVMGGIEAVRQIRDFLPVIPVIALTAYVSSTDEIEAMKVGCNSFQAKPVNSAKLISQINELLFN